MAKSIKSSANVTVKSKDNRKVSTIDKVASASVKSLNIDKAVAILEKALATSENATKDRAKAFYAIKSKTDNFSAWFENNQDDDDKVYGVKYNQASNLANMHNYVWCDKTLNVYDSNKATLLVAYVKKDYAKVVALHKNGIISENMKKSEIANILKKELGGSKAQTVKEGATKEPKQNTINEDINVIEKVIECYLKACKTEQAKEKVQTAWKNILNEVCK